MENHAFAENPSSAALAELKTAGALSLTVLSAFSVSAYAFVSPNLQPHNGRAVIAEAGKLFRGGRSA
jgi:hypothetical protein